MAFTQPSAKPPKIADTIPDTDGKYKAFGEARKKEAFAEVGDFPNTSLEEKLAEPAWTQTTSGAVPPTPPIVSTMIQPLEEDPSAPTEDDKKEFLRCILGQTQYSKKYTLFGDIEVRFVDRSVSASEKIYSELAELVSKGGIKAETDDQWSMWIERFTLAATHVSTATATTGTNFTAQEHLMDKVKTYLDMPRPYYEALMETSRIFEEHVASLTRRAQDTNFWLTGGANLR